MATDSKKTFLVQIVLLAMINIPMYLLSAALFEVDPTFKGYFASVGIAVLLTAFFKWGTK